MYVCMYVRIYVCMYVCMYVYTGMYVCVYVCMCMYVCVNVCVYVCMCMYVCMYVCICVCMYVCICVCMYVYIIYNELKSSYAEAGKTVHVIKTQLNKLLKHSIPYTFYLYPVYNMIRNNTSYKRNACIPGPRKDHTLLVCSMVCNGSWHLTGNLLAL